MPTSPAPTLRVDDREPDDFTRKLRADYGIPARRERLAVADFDIVGLDELVLVTRKASDLLQSLYNGHLTDELERCVTLIQSYGKGRLIFIQEGVWAPAPGGFGYYRRAGPRFFRKTDDRGGAPSALPGLWLSLFSANVGLVPTADHAGTIEALAQIYRRACEGWPSSIAKGMRRPDPKWTGDNRTKHLMGLWPRLRESQAERILQRWGTVFKALDAVRGDTKKFIMETKGIGEQSVRNLLTLGEKKK